MAYFPLVILNEDLINYTGHFKYDGNSLWDTYKYGPNPKSIVLLSQNYHKTTRQVFSYTSKSGTNFFSYFSRVIYEKAYF